MARISTKEILIKEFKRTIVQVDKLSQKEQSGKLLDSKEIEAFGFFTGYQYGIVKAYAGVFNKEIQESFFELYEAVENEEEK